MTKFYSKCLILISALSSLTISVASEIREYTYDNHASFNTSKLRYHYDSVKNTYSIPHNLPEESYQQKILQYTSDPQELSYESVLKKVIIGQDGRIRITATTQWPYSMHAQVTMLFNGKEYGGSGCMVGPHHLLTCGHNVYDHKLKKWADIIKVYPALNDDAAPFGEIAVLKVYTFKKWVEDQNTDYDMALLILDQSIGKNTGWAGLLSLNDQELAHENVQITGYPGDKECKQMWGMTHKIKTLKPEEFKYEIDTYPGQSGSAIWLNKWGVPYIIGVHTRGSDFINSGVRISSKKFTDFLIHLISETYELKNTALTIGVKAQIAQDDPLFILATSGDAQAQYSLGLKYLKGRGVIRNIKEAMKWIQKAADQGLASSQYILGLSFATGLGVSKDSKEAIKWFKEAAGQGHIDAQFHLAGIYYAGKHTALNYGEAMKWFLRAAEQNHPKAQYVISVAYDMGRGVNKDLSESIKWLKKSANQGYAEAENKLGLAYEYGNGVDKNISEAIKWYIRAAIQDHAGAQCHLGMLYAKGETVEKNLVESFKWTGRAAKIGDTTAQFNLALKYYNGEGVAKDYKKAIKWYLRVADKGHAGAQFNLGNMYYKGEGVVIDLIEAYKWYLKAAEQGHDVAQYNIGVAYAKGIGLKKNSVEAVKWFLKSANQGLKEAQFNLGIMYENGDGVLQDNVEANKWFRKAAEQGYAEAQYRLGLAYYNGKGCVKNVAEAKKWLKQAVDQHHAKALEALKKM